MVLRLGTLLCLFYLPCHKEKVKLTLSFQTAADLERLKKKKINLQNMEVYINGLQPGLCFLGVHDSCSPLDQNNLKCKTSDLIYSFTLVNPH